MSTIDTGLDPHPTGAAAAFAAAHSASHPLKLYGSWFCPFVQRAWIVLAEKKIPHQYIEINPYKKEAGFMALNPRGLVPTLKKKTKALYESTVVCEYLDERYVGGDEGRLMPEEDVYERARCRLWSNHIVTRIVPGFYRLLQHTEDKGYPIEEARAELLKGLREFAGEMVDQSPDPEGPWFLGSKFSLVDAMLAPWAKRLFLIDHYKPGGVGIPKKGKRGDDEAVWERWYRWFDAVVERESVKATWSDEEMYIKAYKRYAEDKTQSEVGQATRKGRGLP
ncbi:glutathione S-transferase [Canariomyces notabilis]|uniref:Glutathione S-transferase n=1 Tax=Canariomyces notabilis TaxID=2074819 RepID=A0AAN6TNJ4_9PEZI|nr:glutathione S-transferase [Canariomyces arenarius]